MAKRLDDLANLKLPDPSQTFGGGAPLDFSSLSDLELPKMEGFTLPDSSARGLKQVAMDIQSAIHSFSSPEFFAEFKQKRHEAPKDQVGEVLGYKSNRPMLESGVVLTPDEVAKVNAIINATMDIEQDSRLASHAQDMMTLDTNMGHTQSMDDGNNASWVIRANNIFKAKYEEIENIRTKNIPMLQGSEAFFTGLKEAGKITEEQQAALKVITDKAIVAHEKIIPLLAEAEAMMPNYEKRVDDHFLIGNGGNGAGAGR
jgi:hypothetical protein